jgi:hypothetical protein
LIVINGEAVLCFMVSSVAKRDKSRKLLSFAVAGAFSFAFILCHRLCLALTASQVLLNVALSVIDFVGDAIESDLLF